MFRIASTKTRMPIKLNLVLALLANVAFGDFALTYELETKKLQADIENTELQLHALQAREVDKQNAVQDLTIQQEFASKLQAKINHIHVTGLDWDKQLRQEKAESDNAGRSLKAAMAKLEEATKATSVANATYEKAVAAENEALKEQTEATYEVSQAEASVINCVTNCADQVADLGIVWREKRKVADEKKELFTRADFTYKVALAGLKSAQEAEAHARKRATECSEALLLAHLNYEGTKQNETLYDTQQNLLAMLANQTNVVSADSVQVKSIDNDIVARKRSLRTLDKAILHDRRCVNDSLASETALRTDRAQLIASATQYKQLLVQRSPFPEIKRQGDALWALQDSLSRDTDELIREQKECVSGSTGSLSVAKVADSQDFASCRVIVVIAAVAVGVVAMAHRKLSRKVNMPQGLLG